MVIRKTGVAARQITKYVVALRTISGMIVKAFDVCIKDDDVYMNYSDSSTPEYHKSYHASGQQHYKIEGKYIQWTGGPTGHWEPMKMFCTPPGRVTGRSHVCTIGWEIARLDQVLPKLREYADLLVDTQRLGGAVAVCFQVDVIGSKAHSPKNILGFPLIARQQFGSAPPRVEITAFVMAEEEGSSALS